MSKTPPEKSQSLVNITPLQLYLQEIAKYPLLSPEEELEAAVDYFESGDRQSAHRLITSNLRLVVKISNDFKQAQMNLLDLIQEGNYGLMQAVKRFNPYKGVKLSSYAAWWIRAYILKYTMDNKSQVKIGTTAAQRKLFYNLKKEAEKLLSEHEKADPKLIAESLNVKEKDVVEMQKRLQAPDLSLDTPIGSGDSQTTKGDLISDEGLKPVDELLASEQEKARFTRYIEEFRAQLKERDLDFLEKRILSEEPWTLQELGDKYGITRERARQIEAQIVKKLKQFVKDKGDLDI